MLETVLLDLNINFLQNISSSFSVTLVDQKHLLALLMMAPLIQYNCIQFLAMNTLKLIAIQHYSTLLISFKTQLTIVNTVALVQV